MVHVMRVFEHGVCHVYVMCGGGGGGCAAYVHTQPSWVWIKLNLLVGRNFKTVLFRTIITNGRFYFAIFAYTMKCERW